MTTLIGIDCATQSKKMGIAVGQLNNGAVHIDYIGLGLKDPARYVVEAVAQNGKALLALDAPLGWPADLGSDLSVHWAGMPLATEPNQLFRRETDRFIKRRIGKQSLDVGADRIARTAHAANSMLASVRVGTNQQIPLAWTSTHAEETSCIEVYPAATLEARQISSRGYKGSDGRFCEARERLLEQLKKDLILEGGAVAAAIANDDAFDAAICCLAAADFVRGLALEPDDLEKAQKEGWIWVHAPLA